MTQTNCSVCGYPKKACLHQKEFNEDKYDLRVTRILWFFIGFIVCFVSVLIIT